MGDKPMAQRGNRLAPKAVVVQAVPAVGLRLGQGVAENVDKPCKQWMLKKLLWCGSPMEAALNFQFAWTPKTPRTSDGCSATG